MKTEVRKFRIAKYERVRIGEVKTIENVDYTIIQIIDIEMDYEFGAEITVLAYVAD